MLWLVAFRYQRRLAILLTPVIAGLIVATVYAAFTTRWTRSPVSRSHSPSLSRTGSPTRANVRPGKPALSDQLRVPGRFQGPTPRLCQPKRQRILVCVTDLFALWSFATGGGP